MVPLTKLYHVRPVRFAMAHGAKIIHHPLMATFRQALTGLAAAIGLAAAPAFAQPLTIVTPFDSGSSNSTTLQADHQGLLTVETFINGRGPFRFIVDTGANRSAVSWRLAYLLGLPALGLSEVHGVTGARTTTLTRVDVLKAGSMQIEGAALPILEDDLLGGADGMLGMEAMAGKRLEFDTRASTLTVQDSTDALIADHWKRIPVKLEFGNLAFVSGQTDGVPITIVIDTGAERTIVNEALARAVARKTARAVAGTRIVSAGKAVSAGSMLSLSGVQLGGGVGLAKANVYVGDFHIFKLWGLEDRPAMLIGMDVLKSPRAFAIDYGRQELQFRFE